MSESEFETESDHEVPLSAVFADTSGPGSGRFVVACPACAAEAPRRPEGIPKAREACDVCDGLGSVPRVVAERYALDANPAL